MLIELKFIQNYGIHKFENYLNFKFCRLLKIK